MFDVDALIFDCQSAMTEVTPPTAMRSVLSRVLSDRGSVATTLGHDEAGIEILYNAADLTALAGSRRDPQRAKPAQPLHGGHSCLRR